jgi:hypothetical protein
MSFNTFSINFQTVERIFLVYYQDSFYERKKINEPTIITPEVIVFDDEPANVADAEIAAINMILSKGYVSYYKIYIT